MVANEALLELQDTLGQISDTLTAMSLALHAQRETVATSDLPRLLVITGEQENLGARLERLERRRLRIQEVAERELGVSGVHALSASLEELGAGSDMRNLAATIESKVRTLQNESRQSAQLLRSAIDQAQKTRQYLLRLAGAATVYTAGAMTP